MKSLDRKVVKENVKEAYGRIAIQEGGSCCGESTVDTSSLSRSIGYSDSEIAAVPESANLGLGCGNPTAFTKLRPGETVLDLGSGAGFDCFLAAQKVGGGGKVIGVDMTPEMIEKARKNAKLAGYHNVEFRQGDIENLPVQDNSIDVVISNCVINLAPDKKRVFEEIYRVLKPGGRLMISDIVLKRPLPENVLNSIEAYVGCVSGAMLLDEYVDLAGKSGLQDVKVVVNAESSCANTEGQDPVMKKLIAEVENPQLLQNSIVSINLSASKKVR